MLSSNSARPIFVALSFVILFSYTGKKIIEQSRFYNHFDYENEICLLISFLLSHFLAAYDPLDPNGNITIKWDVMSWTPDGYVVSTTKCVF